MQKLIVIAVAALCLIGTSSLALADDAMKAEMKAEKSAMKGEMKGKMKAHKGEMKVKRHEMKGKMKTHKGAAKPNPAVAAPMSAPAPVAAP
jgi:carbon monoxide dehydrogenase subunit G